MKKPSSKIRKEFARLQDQLKQAENCEAERIGRIALRAGLDEIDVAAFQVALEEIAKRFRGGKGPPASKKQAGESRTGIETPAAFTPGAHAGGAGEA
jgi:hypothetical protein